MPYADPKKAAASKRAWQKNNPEKVRIRNKKWRVQNPEKSRQSTRNYRLRNPKKVQQSISAWKKRQYREDLEYRLSSLLRVRVWKALNGIVKSARTLELLGCTLPELRAHLEKQFRPGMTWENYGPVWHVDHTKPCAKFDLSDSNQQRACFHFSNLQPLFAKENLRKGAK